MLASIKGQKEKVSTANILYCWMLKFENVFYTKMCS